MGQYKKWGRNIIFIHVYSYTWFISVKFKTSSIESVYSLKKYTKRPKDITDIKKLEPYIDKRKLELLDKYPNKNIIIENVNLNNIHINKK